ncbi:MAG: DUF805 domain-containing protein [Roseovarius sp.]
MNFQTAVKTCLIEKYAGYSGRASRPEYWWFILAYVIGGVLVSLTGSTVLYLAYMLAILSPAAAAGYRRLQDTGRPGWYIFVPIGLAIVAMILTPATPTVPDGQIGEMPDMGNMGLLAIIGVVQIVVALVFLWWLTRPSQPETNQYGPPPSR